MKLAAVAAVSVMLCTPASTQPILPVNEPAARIAVVLADGRLQLYSGMADSLTREWTIAPFMLSGPEPQLEQSPDGRTLVLLAKPRFMEPGQSRLVSVDLRTMRLTSRVLTGAFANSGAFALHPQTGALFLVGYDAVGVWVAEFDAKQLAPKRRWIALPVNTGVDSSSRIMASLGPRWRAYGATIDPATQTMIVSFHGGVDGAELIRLDGNPTVRCPAATPTSSCIGQHGDVGSRPSGLFTATGSQIVRFFGRDSTRREIDTGLPGNHLMQFMVDRDDAAVLAVGSCFFGRGFSMTAVSSSATDPPLLRLPQVCGESISADLDERWIVVTRLRGSMTLSRGPGSLRFVSLPSGETIREREVPGPPIDVLVLRPYGR
ncbi:MAG: hypothetical protein IPO52_02365 [Gemmatimonadetes bacterium]|nr:hypothetical protein [Gemmatimonadota bacterium]